MCRSCGEFVTAKKVGDTWMPASNDCPNCGGVEFKHNGSDTVVRAGE